MKKLIFLLILISLNTFAWKVKSHVAIGREIIKEIMNTDSSMINLIDPDTLETQSINIDPTIFNCIKTNPAYFMAGNLGPDGFPDIFTGQMATHIENIENVTHNGIISLDKLKLHICPFTSDSQEETDCRDAIIKELSLPSNFDFNGNNSIGDFDNTKLRKLANIPYKYRKPTFWRSIDWAHFLINEATKPLYFVEIGSDIAEKSSHVVWKEVDRLKEEGTQYLDYFNNNTNGEKTLAGKLRCEAIAFSYGYLNHMTSDSFGHQYINLLAGDSWDFVKGGIKEEVRHLAVEGYIDHLLRPWLFQNNTNVYKEEEECDFDLDQNREVCTSTPCITNIFEKVPNECELKNPAQASPNLNLPLYDLKLPDWFLMDTLMSETIVKAAPLSYHIKLFRELKVIIRKSEEKMAYGEACTEDTECDNEYGECLDTGYCRKSYSSAYDAIDNECARPSASAYLFNECFRIGGMFGDGSNSKFTKCITDLKDYALLLYLKGVDKRIDEGMKKWLDTSANLMRHGMMEDPESNDFTTEDQACKYITEYDKDATLCVNNGTPITDCLKSICGETRHSRCNVNSNESKVNLCKLMAEEGNNECLTTWNNICESDLSNPTDEFMKTCDDPEIRKNYCKTEDENISQEAKMACLNEFNALCSDCYTNNMSLCVQEVDEHNHYTCISRKKFDDDTSPKINRCTPKVPKLPLGTAINSYVEILNYILKPDDDNPLKQMLAFSCDDIGRYNYIEICEATKKEFEKNIDKLVETVQGKLREKMINYLKPILVYTAKLQLLLKKYSNPDALLGFAYCNGSDRDNGGTGDNNSTLDACFNSCNAKINLNANNELGVSAITCGDDCENLFRSCPKSESIKKKVLEDMGLKKVSSGNIIGATPELLFFNELNSEHQIDYCISSNESNDYDDNNKQFICWHRELLKAGKRYSFLSGNSQKQKDFYKRSPFKNFKVLFNSVQINKLSLITKDNMREVYTRFGTTHRECLNDKHDGSFVYEAIASLDGSSDVDGDPTEKFYELKKEPRFCLLSEGDNDVFNTLFMVKSNNSSDLIRDDLSVIEKPTYELSDKRLKPLEYKKPILKREIIKLP